MKTRSLYFWMLLTPLLQRWSSVGSPRCRLLDIPRRTSHLPLIWGDAGKGEAKGKAKGKGKAAPQWSWSSGWFDDSWWLPDQNVQVLIKSSRFCVFRLCGGYLCSLLTFCCGGHEFNWPDILCKGVGCGTHQSPITNHPSVWPGTVAISKIRDDHGLHGLKSDNLWPFDPLGNPLDPHQLNPPLAPVTKVVRPLVVCFLMTQMWRPCEVESK